MIIWACTQWLTNSIRECFDIDLARANIILSEKSKELETVWHEGAGRTGEDAINSLSPIEIDWAWQVANDEHREEVERLRTRIDRASAAATTNAVVVAVVTTLVVNAIEVLASPLSASNIGVSLLVIKYIFFFFYIVMLASLFRSVNLSLSVLQTVPTLKPSFEDFINIDLETTSYSNSNRVKGLIARVNRFHNDPTRGEKIRLLQRKKQSLRTLLYSAARNGAETNRCFNSLDASIRHLQDGLLCLLPIGLSWIGVETLLLLRLYNYV